MQTLLCSHFQPSLHLDFGNVDVTSINTKVFRLLNTNTTPVMLEVEKCPQQKGVEVCLDHSFSTSITIEPNSSIYAQVHWSPQMDMTMRDVVIIKMDSKISLQLIVQGVSGNGVPIHAQVENSFLNKPRRTTFTTVVPRKKQRQTSRPMSNIPMKSIHFDASDNQLVSFKDWINFTFSTNLTISEEPKIPAYLFDACCTELSAALLSEITDEKISVRADLNIHADVGLQQDLFELLFAYELPYLILALSILFADPDINAEEKQAGLSSAFFHYASSVSIAKQISYIKSIVRDRVLNDPLITARFAKHLPLNIHYEGQMKGCLRRHFLRKMLLLIRLLDLLRVDEVLKLPRLFTLRATNKTKSSNGALLTLNKLFLHGEGLIINHLAALGYTVKFEQTYVEECDYTVKSIPEDLRDGVKLAKLIEILMNQKSQSEDNNPLTEESSYLSRIKPQKYRIVSSLRVPPVSRLQKIHNVVQSLRALSTVGDFALNLDPGTSLNKSMNGTRLSVLSLSSSFSFGEDRLTSEAKQIVDGDKETAMLLLWRLMFTYNLQDLVSPKDLLREADRVGHVHDERPNIDELNENVIRNCLLYWLESVVQIYSLHVQDLSHSLADGAALCVLIHHYWPQWLPFKSIHRASTDTQSEVQENVDKQTRNFMNLRKACKSIGKIPLLSTDYSTRVPPDERTMVFFLCYLFSRVMVDSVRPMAASIIQIAFRRKFLDSLNCSKRINEHGYKFQHKKLAVTVLVSKHYYASVIQNSYRKYISFKKYNLMQEQLNNVETSDVFSSLVLEHVPFIDEQVAAQCSDTAVIPKRILSEISPNIMLNSPAPKEQKSVSFTPDQQGVSKFVERTKTEFSIKNESLSKYSKLKRGVVATPQSLCDILLENKENYAQGNVSNLYVYHADLQVSPCSLSNNIDANLCEVNAEDAFNYELKLKEVTEAVELSWREKYLQESILTDELIHRERSARISAELQATLEAERRIFLESKLQLIEAEREQAEQQLLQRKVAAEREQKVIERAKNVIGQIICAYVSRRRSKKLARSIIKLQALSRSFVLKRFYKRFIISVILLQALWRRKVFAREMSKMSCAATLIQRRWKHYQLSERRHQVMCKAVITVQAMLRSLKCQKDYHQQHEASIIIQNHSRRYLTRKHYKNKLRLIQMIQSRVRSYLCRKYFQSTLSAGRKIVRFVHKHHRRIIQKRRQEAMNAHRIKYLRSSVIIARFLVRIVVKKRVHKSVSIIERWMLACIPLVRCRKLLRGFVRLQALVRAIRVRSELPEKLHLIRGRLNLSNEKARGNPHLKMCNRFEEAISLCEDLSSTTLADLKGRCEILYFGTEYSPILRTRLSETIPMSILMAIIKSCNRSAPHQQLLGIALGTLLNICYDNNLCRIVTEDLEPADAIIDVMQMFRDISSIFSMASEVLLKFMESSEYLVGELRDGSKDNRRRLEAIKHLLERRNKLEMRVRLVKSDDLNDATHTRLGLHYEISQLLPVTLFKGLSDKLRLLRFNGNESLEYSRLVARVIA